MFSVAQSRVATSAGARERILCCLCGMSIEPNPANMCSTCVSQQVDVTEGIDRHPIIFQCRKCLRWQRSATGGFSQADLESTELLAICLKRIQGLTKVKLLDASFIWTEPHSKRLKVKLVVKKEIESMNNLAVTDSMVVEFVVQNQQCPECGKQATNDTWRGLVQVRQKVEHKRTFYVLEQQIIKSNAQANCLQIHPVKDGVDFYFNSRSEAERFSHFLAKHVPQRTRTSEKLVSEDVKNSTANLKTTISAEIAPVCRDDIMILPPRLVAQCSSIFPCVLVSRIASSIHVIDPFTLRSGDISADKFWRDPVWPLATSRDMVEFTVLDVEPLQRGQRTERTREFTLADAEVIRSSDFGVTDDYVTVRTHLGQVLNAGDTVLGYDFRTSNFNDRLLHYMKGKELPQIILVRKIMPRTRAKSRKLRSIGMTAGGDAKGKKEKGPSKAELDYELFLHELEEEDPDGLSTASVPADAVEDSDSPDLSELKASLPPLSPAGA